MLQFLKGQIVLHSAYEHTEVEHEGRGSDLLDGEERLGLHGANLLGRLLRGGNYFGVSAIATRIRLLHHAATISHRARTREEGAAKCTYILQTW